MTTAIYFSATDTTKRITEAVAACSSEEVASLNLTQRGCPRSFSASDTVVVGVSVYAGRVPSGARRFAGVPYTIAAQKFTKANSTRRQPEWFI